MPQPLSSALEMSTSSVIPRLSENASQDIFNTSWHLHVKQLKSTLILIPNKLKSLYIPRKEHRADSRSPMSNTQRQAFRELIMLIWNVHHRSKTKAPWSGLMLPNFIPATLGSAALGFPPPWSLYPNCEHRATLSFTRSSEAHTLSTYWNAELLRTSHHSGNKNPPVIPLPAFPKNN